MSELLGISSAAAVTPLGATDILGLEADGSDDERISSLFSDDPLLSFVSPLARTLVETHELSFAIVFDPDASRGVLYDGNTYTEIKAESIEGAIASLFR